MIIINRDGIDYSFDDAEAAIDFLMEGKKQIFQKEYSHDCNKCVWQYNISCSGDPKHCNNYKRDAPDGGYYG